MNLFRFFLIFFGLGLALGKWVPAQDVPAGGHCGDIICPPGTICHRPDEFDLPRVCLGTIMDLRHVFVPDSAAPAAPPWPLVALGICIGLLLVLLAVCLAQLAMSRQTGRLFRRLLDRIPPPLPVPAQTVPVVAPKKRVSFHQQPEAAQPTVSLPFAHFQTLHQSLPNLGQGQPASSASQFV